MGKPGEEQAKRKRPKKSFMKFTGDMKPKCQHKKKETNNIKTQQKKTGRDRLRTRKYWEYTGTLIGTYTKQRTTKIIRQLNNMIEQLGKFSESRWKKKMRPRHTGTLRFTYWAHALSMVGRWSMYQIAQLPGIGTRTGPTLA